MNRIAIALFALCCSISAALSLPMLGGYTQTAYNINVQDYCGPSQMTGAADATSCVQAAINAAYNNGIELVYCPAGATLVTSSTIYQDRPNNLTSNLSNPPYSNFSISFVGLSGPNHEGSGRTCIIKPNFNNAVAWYVGPGRGMRLSGVLVQGPNGGYRCGQNSSGVGVAISAYGSLAQVENVWAENFYDAFSVGPNNNDLADSTTFRKIYFNNACNGVHIPDTQAFITSIYDMTGSATTAVLAPVGTNVYVYGGNPSATNSKAASFTISSVGSVAAVSQGNSYDYTFQATIASPDSYVNTVYNAYTIVTADYGVIPCTLTAYNAGTGVGTFTTYSTWGRFYFAGVNALSVSNLATEIGAVTTLYAAEMVTVFEGSGINVLGTHIENPGAATRFIYTYQAQGARNTADIGDVFFDADPTLAVYSPLGSPTSAQLAEYYAQQAFGFIEVANEAVHIHDIDFNADGAVPLPLNVDWDQDGAAMSQLTAERLTDSYGFNQRVVSSSGGAYSFSKPTPISSSMLGGGVWDRNYNNTVANTDADAYRTVGFESSPQWGFRPASWSRACLTPAQVTALTGSLPAVTPTSVSYPLLYGGQEYQLCDWYMPSQTYYNLLSVHHFYSYGQDLTTSVIPSLSWSAIGQGFAVYVNDRRMLFPGLGIKLNTSANDEYIVTGVFPGICSASVTGAYCGYVTVALAQSNAGGLVAGVSGTVYTGTTIGQDTYSFKQW